MAVMDWVDIPYLRPVARALKALHLRQAFVKVNYGLVLVMRPLPRACGVL